MSRAFPAQEPTEQSGPFADFDPGCRSDEEAAGRDADVLIVGDLNDDPWDASVVRSLGAVRSRNAVLNREKPRQLYNLSWGMLAEPDIGTLYYNPEWNWNVFDQAIVSSSTSDT